jgi:hypothetical protein
MRRHDDLTLKEAARIGLVAFLLGATLFALLQNFALKAYEGRQEPPRAAEAARTPSDKAAR